MKKFFVLAVIVSVLSFASTAKANGGSTTATTCNPVTSLVAKTDARVSELNFASLSVSYSVKTCYNGQTLTVTRTVSEYLNPSVVLYDVTSSSDLSSKFTLNTIKNRVTYKITVTVLDVAAQNVIGSSSILATSVPKV